MVVVYRVTNGIATSRATMTLETAEDFDNPPVVFDAFGRADDSGSVVVDVLEGAYDPDGSADDLRSPTSSGDPSATVVDGAQVRADRGAAPKVLPFRVVDADGAAAAASVYVPPTGTGLPYVLPDALIELDSGDSIDRGSPTTSPPRRGPGAARLGSRSYSASPSALIGRPGGDNRFVLSAAAASVARGRSSWRSPRRGCERQRGHVHHRRRRDGAAVHPGPGRRRHPRARVSLDGRPDLGRPALRPRHRHLLQGLHRRPARRRRPDLRGRVGRGIDGLDAGRPVGSVVASRPRRRATAGGEAVLTVRAGESNVEEIRFRLAQAPAPTLLPIRVETMEAGQSRTYDLRSYLQAGVAHPLAHLRLDPERRQPGRARHHRVAAGSR